MKLFSWLFRKPNPKIITDKNEYENCVLDYQEHIENPTPNQRAAFYHFFTKGMSLDKVRKEFALKRKDFRRLKRDIKKFQAKYRMATAQELNFLKSYKIVPIIKYNKFPDAPNEVSYVKVSNGQKCSDISNIQKVIDEGNWEISEPEIPTVENPEVIEEPEEKRYCNTDPKTCVCLKEVCNASGLYCK
jgi:hypothetical protein